MEQTKYNTEKKKWKQISEKERYQIEIMAKQGFTVAQIGKSLDSKRDRRTIERELQRGKTVQRNSDLTEKAVYLAEVGQRKHDESAANKGRSLKIGHDHKLAKHIECKIKDERWSPGAVVGNIKTEGLQFATTICTKTVYNYIDKGIFAGLSSKDLWMKKCGKKRGYRKGRHPNAR